MEEGKGKRKRKGKREKYLYLGVIGYPAFHSLSPAMHSEVMKKMRIEGFYHAFEVEPENFVRAVRGARSLGFTGLNITLPFKERAYRIANVVHGDAKFTEAVNTLKFSDGLIEGYNTDVYGFIKSLDKVGFRLKGKNIAVFGSGGAARAIVFASLKEKVKKVSVFARNTKKAEKMVGKIIEKINEKMEGKDRKIRSEIEIKNIDDVEFEEFDIFVNATSLGWKQENLFEVIGKNPPKNRNKGEKKLFYDTVYVETSFLKTAKELGYETMDGKWMLVLQGAKSFELWTGIYPDENIMMTAIIREMRRRK